MSRGDNACCQFTSKSKYNAHLALTFGLAKPTFNLLPCTESSNELSKEVAPYKLERYFSSSNLAQVKISNSKATMFHRDGYHDAQRHAMPLRIHAMLAFQKEEMKSHIISSLFSCHAIPYLKNTETLNRMLSIKSSSHVVWFVRHAVNAQLTKYSKDGRKRNISTHPAVSIPQRRSVVTTDRFGLATTVLSTQGSSTARCGSVRTV